MNQNNPFTIKATVELKFIDSKTRDISYNSFLPELDKLNTKRSKIKMEKKENLLIFHIESSDITAFRASISDIIGLGRIVEDTLKLCYE